MSIIPIGIILMLFDWILKQIGAIDFSKLLINLFSVPLAITWLLGFMLSGLLTFSEVSGLKILLIVVGIFFIATAYSALNYAKMKAFVESEDGVRKFKKRFSK
ncbi:hypothetical protein [Sphingobacterium corticis]|uniref:hypothetical protein n=1 Tax=Sphingobacterium corticis TaxID=1812823 RepID=UPI0036D43B84